MVSPWVTIALPGQLMAMSWQATIAMAMPWTCYGIAAIVHGDATVIHGNAMTDP